MRLHKSGTYVPETEQEFNSLTPAGWQWLQRYAIDVYSAAMPQSKGFDPCAVLGNIAQFMADRAEMVLPDSPLSESLPLLMAIAQQDHAGTLAALNAMPTGTGDKRMTADEAMDVGEMLHKAGSGELLAVDEQLQRIDGAPTRVARRSDGTVKGRLGAHVIGRMIPWHLSPDMRYGKGDNAASLSLWDDTYCAALAATGDYVPDWSEREMLRVDSAELISRANITMRLSDGEYVPMIGTEVGSWAQVIEHEPITVELDYLTVNGAPIGPIVFAPYGAGDSISGSAETAKRRSGWQRTAISYSVRPVETVHVPTWGTDGAALRIVKRYNTSAALVNGARRSTITGGKRGWQHPKPRVSRVKRDANVRTLSHDDAVTLICDEMRTAIDTKRTAHKITAKTTEGVRFTAALALDERAVRVTVSHDGHVTRRTVRTVVGIASTLNKHRPN